MSKMALVVSSAAMLITLTCCGLYSSTLVGDQGSQGCPSILPPETFQESDLVGTWVAKYGRNATDTLIIKADGTYKQIYINSITRDDFESDWQTWRLQIGESGMPHLHLKGMRKCDGSTERCRREGGGGDDILWFDYCENRLISMRGEVVLLVAGASSNGFQPPRGILLYQLSPDGDSPGGTFMLQE